MPKPTKKELTLALAKLQKTMKGKIVISVDLNRRALIGSPFMRLDPPPPPPPPPPPHKTAAWHVYPELRPVLKLAGKMGDFKVKVNRSANIRSETITINF